MGKAEERTLARDFVMARLAACRANIAAAAESLDAALGLFVTPGEDKAGKHRADFMEEVDDALGAAAIAVHAAQEVWTDVDPKEGEPEFAEDDEDEDEDEDEEDEDDDEED